MMLATPLTIMIVEDNVELCHLYERILNVKGYRILCCCENGQEASDFYGSISEYPSLIIMDYRMPLKDGITASQEILRMNPDQKILVVSADTSIQSDVSEIGDIQFLKKPFHINDLMSRISEMLTLVKTQ